MELGRSSAVNTGLGFVEIKPHVLERRRFRRYHYSAPIFIRSSAGAEARGMSLEISECGMSLLATASLRVGDIVELEPVGGETAKAILRRTMGRLHAFEFLALSSAQRKKIRRMCKLLPAYRVKTLDIRQN
jgi:hypothetical protein